MVEMAYAYQARSTLRAMDFVNWVCSQKVPDPSGARVRVMSIHAAKGLQFDAVVLPQLDGGLIGQPPAFVASRDPDTLAVDFVCRYAKDALQALLATQDKKAFEEYRRQRVEESLSVLYVALTRAIRALYLFVPGPRTEKEKEAWYNLLLSTLTPDVELTENTLLFKDGDPAWFRELATEAVPAEQEETEEVPQIRFREAETGRRRGLDQVAPSSREGGGHVPLRQLFEPSTGTGTAAGTLYHAWFALIAWLDHGAPTEKALRAEAEKLRNELPANTWDEIEDLLAKFQSWLQHPIITSALSRSAYANPQVRGFPARLTSCWTKQIQPLRVEQERRFLVQDGDKLWNGSLDRVIWLGQGEQILAADVIDFKTDDIPPGNDSALNARVEHYRPQMDAYRRAVSRLGHIEEQQISVRLLFTNAGRVVDV
jgi:ATP-dependent exoDNAse (exonuclease V) beta subunit